MQISIESRPLINKPISCFGAQKSASIHFKSKYRNAIRSFPKYLFLLLLITSSQFAKSQELAKPLPYSQFRVSNGLVFISGQTDVLANTGRSAYSNFDIEVANVMAQIKRILETYRLDFSAIINMTVYLQDIHQYNAFNRVYIKYFKGPLPSRSCVTVKSIPNGAHVEIAAIAAIKK